MAKNIKYRLGKRNANLIRDGVLGKEKTLYLAKEIYNRLSNLGANQLEAYSTENFFNFEYDSIYEFPRQGAVDLKLKAIARDQRTNLEEHEYNACINLLGFKEETKKYNKIVESLEKILINQELNKI